MNSSKQKPLLKGGQGRTPDDLTETAQILCLLLLGAITLTSIYFLT